VAMMIKSCSIDYTTFDAQSGPFDYYGLLKIIVFFFIFFLFLLESLTLY